VERQKGTARISFVCGFRALQEARENARVLASARSKLSAGRDEIEKVIDRIQADFAEARKMLHAADRKLAEVAGRELAARGRVIVELCEGKGIDYLRTLANSIVAQPGKIAILGGSGETSSVVIARSADVPLDLRPFFKEVLETIQGKGGGPAHFVQGGGPGKDLQGALKVAEGSIRANLGA
jgi:alanyl-tRNA synthetase